MNMNAKGDVCIHLCSRNPTWKDMKALTLLMSRHPSFKKSPKSPVWWSNLIERWIHWFEFSFDATEARADSQLTAANKHQRVSDVLVIKYEWMSGYCQICYIYWRPAEIGSAPSHGNCMFALWLTSFSGSNKLIYAPLRQWHLIIIL